MGLGRPIVHFHVASVRRQREKREMLVVCGSYCRAPLSQTLVDSSHSKNLNKSFVRLSFRTSKSRRPCNIVCFRLGLQDLSEILHNKVLIAAGVSAAIGQLSKPFTSLILYGKDFDFKAAFQAGGFPSTHSSAVVATATTLALERGFSDSIFGITVVYASLVMYDAQGVRREVGNHARSLNKVLAKSQVESSAKVDRADMIDSEMGKSSPLKLESLDPLLSKETNSFALRQQTNNAPLLLRSEKKRTLASWMKMSSGFEGDDEREANNSSASQLKESIGHTEVEVMAGALLGFFVSLGVYTMM